MRIYLVRHGQTHNNSQNRVTGQGDDQLTDLGRQQADILGKWMSETMDIQIDAFCASDLSRAVDTTAIVVRYYDDAPVHTDHRFQERFLGGLTGHQKPLPKDRLSYPDVESDEEVVARCHSGMLDLLFKYADQAVCVVAHGGVIWRRINSVCETIYDKRPSNTSISFVDWDGEQGVCLFYDLTDHLD